MYEEWIQNPEPYGGLAVLQLIKESKENDNKELFLKETNISNIEPIEGLNKLESLNLEENKKYRTSLHLKIN